MFTDEDAEKCIICQTVTGEEEKSFSDGRKRIIEASAIRQDDVTERLSRLDHEHFVYHIAIVCYKQYIHKQKLLKLQSTSQNSLFDINQNELNQ